MTKTPYIQASAPKEIPGSFQATLPDAKLSIQAAEAVEGQNPGPAKITLLANTGQPMMLDGFFHPVVVDMASAKFDKSRTPILMDHDVAKRIGHTTDQAVTGETIEAVGIVSSRSQVAQEFIEDARADFPFQVSIGAQPGKGTFYLDKGEKTTVNGRTHKGPLIVAKNTRIRELTVTVLGADPNTSATIAASHRSETVSFEDYVKSLGLDANTITAEQTVTLKAAWKAAHGGDANPPANPPAAPATPPAPIQAAPASGPTLEQQLQARRQAEADEDRRLGQVRQIFARYDGVQTVDINGVDTPVADLRATAIQEGWDADRVELVMMRAERNINPPAGPAIHAAQQVRDLDSSAISCALLRASGRVPRSRQRQEHEGNGEAWGWEHFYPEQTLEASDHPALRSASLHQVFDLIIQAANGWGFSGNRRSQEFISATRAAMIKIKAAGGSGMSTLEATNIFDDLANKFLLAGYQSINTTWQEWAGVRSVNDFKTHNLYRLTHKGSYQQVGADGLLKHGGFTDDKYTISADTYGKIVGMTRKDMINDDLDALGGILTALGIEAAKFLEELAYVQLLTQVGTTWVAGNNNLGSGAGSDLGIAGLGASAKLFEDQVDADNAPILIEPDRILVGTQDRVEAGQLFKDTDIREGMGSTSTKDKIIKNPHVSAFRPIVSGYLNNTNIKRRVASIGTAIPNQDTNQWFMFGNPANPQGATIMMAFLNGNRTPFLEQSDAAFDMLGLQWRAYHDAGTGVGDPKLSVRNAGA